MPPQSARHAAHFLLACLLAACGGGGDPPPDGGVDPGKPVRWWQIAEYPDGDEVPVVVEHGSQIGGDLLHKRVFGPVMEFVDRDHGDNDGVAGGEIYSDATGATYWVWAQAPNFVASATGGPAGNHTRLTQYQRFRKIAADATFRYVVTQAFVFAFDGSNVADWSCRGTTVRSCSGPVYGAATLDVTVQAVDDDPQTLPRQLHHAAGFVSLDGWPGNWTAVADTYKWSPQALWSPPDFFVDPDAGGDGSQQFAWITLLNPRTIAVDISSVPVGSDFQVQAVVTVDALDRRQNESYVAAYLRDPRQTGGGVGFETSGLVAVKAEPAEVPPALRSAGTIEFLRDTFRTHEYTGEAGARIVVTRAGGNAGEVSVTFTTVDDTATAGSDYETTRQVITFAEGDDAPRLIRVPIVRDAGVENEESVRLELSAPTGGAALGGQATAVLRIADSPPPTATFALGGTITGLAGTGLVLGGPFSNLAPTGNGAFTFPERMADGLPYVVRVLTQPTGPAQVCTVTDGAGTIAGADVTNVKVDCVTPPPNGSLDPAFGTGGKVGIPGASAQGEAIALQPDGAILLAGRSNGDFALLRVLADGRPDPGFGNGGLVTTDFAGSTDEAFDLALHADGRIVVVGRVRSGTGYDFGIAQYLPDGRLDPSFGTGGKVTLDLGGADYAQAVVIQPDDRIVVGGHGGSGADFALVRLTPTGGLDPSFGSGGRVTTHITGTDLAYDLAIAPDGKLVLAGRAPASVSGSIEDFALVRYLDDGRIDTAFGSQGVVRLDAGTGLSDIAEGVLVQGDGRILVAGTSGGDVALLRLTAGGLPDSTFGTQGFVRTDLSGAPDFGRALAQQADGRIVVAGHRTSATVYDVAVLRYLSDGSLDTGFGNGGAVVVDHAGGGDFGQAIAVQPDGRIVVGGYGLNGASAEFVLMRVLP